MATINTYIHTYIHTYTHTHTHIRAFCTAKLFLPSFHDFPPVRSGPSQTASQPTRTYHGLSIYLSIHLSIHSFDGDFRKRASGQTASPSRVTNRAVNGITTGQRGKKRARVSAAKAYRANEQTKEKGGGRASRCGHMTYVW